MYELRNKGWVKDCLGRHIYESLKEGIGLADEEDVHLTSLHEQIQNASIHRTILREN